METWMLEYIKVFKFEHMLVFKNLIYHVAPSSFLNKQG